MRYETPSGLVGLGSRDPIGVHVAVAVKGKSGAPTYGGRWWFMSHQTHSEEFVSSQGKRRRDLTRSPAAGFEKWNAAAKALGRNLPEEGPGRLGILRGVLVHAKMEDAALWRRGMYRFPEGHQNPKTRRHACTGNGITATRYMGAEDGQERYETIACPNRECEFAMCGACKPEGNLLFQLRWRADDPWEAEFPQVLAFYDTHGWETTEGIRGLFEYVLGTEALLTEEERKVATLEQRAKWKRGLAQELGISDVSLVGLPFVMTVSEKTRRADEQSPHGKRNVVVNFSWDGQLIPWLLAQREQKLLLSEGNPSALPPAPISVNSPEFVNGPMIEAVAEAHPGSGDHTLPGIEP